jgi:hypothetical protein
MVKIKIVIAITWLWSFYACQQKPDALFKLINPADSGITFENTLEETPELNVMRYEYLYNGGGVAAGDFNNDGLCDLYFTGNTVPNKLYLNKTKNQELKFEDVTEKARVAGRERWKTGVTVADVNADGWLDIYVCYSGPMQNDERDNELYINNGCEPGGIPTFTESAKKYGLEASGTFSTHASFFDYDRDGDLDMFLLNHGNRFYGPFFNTRKLRSQRHPQFGNRLYRNDGNKFVEVSDSAGINGGGLNFGLSVSVADVNDDGWLDLYVTNDYEEQDFFYLNNQKGGFTEVTKQSMAHISRYGMGSDIADYNNDLKPDIMVVDMLPEDNHRQKMLKGPDDYNRYTLMVDSGYHHQNMRNTLQVNQGNIQNNLPVFAEIGQLAGVSNTDWSWAPLLADFDNDGYKDLYITNGYLRDFTNMDFLKYTVADARDKAQREGTEVPLYDLIKQMPSTKVSNYIFQNNHKNNPFTFVNKTTDWGMQHPDMSFGAVYADLDNDGDLDLITNNTNEPASIWQNQSDRLLQHNYLKIKLNGIGNNTLGIGAKVYLTLPNGSRQMQQVMLSRGYQSSVEPTLLFGLGKEIMVKEVKIVWQSGKTSILNDVKSNQLLIVFEKNAIELKENVKTVREKLFQDITNEIGLNFTHRENAFVDFNHEPLIPYQLSRQGPHLAKADVNGDGLEDLFVGGAAGQAGQLFLQTTNGTFRAAPQQPWQQDAACEDIGSTFFDADQDGDADLYIVSGGTEFALGAPELQDRLYLNDGKGNFKKAPAGSIPAEFASGSCVAAADYDRDGDLDLFVGGRIHPGSYPLTSPGGILRNDFDKTTKKVRFTVATKEVNPALRDLGMVTDAVWTDLNADGWMDLVVVGEWMPVQIFMNQYGKLNSSITLENSNGFWQKILAEDMDGDGDVDLVIGNMGTNAQWKASSQEPLTLHYADFDGNGRIDPLICSYIQGISYPIAPLDDLKRQINSTRKKFVKYASYADATLEKVIPADSLKKAKVLKTNNLQSIYIENQGNGKFVIKPLPTEAQFSMVCGLLADDFDKDGKKDILLAGNFYPFRVEYGRFDAGQGLLLRGTGKGSFNPITWQQSGFYAPGDVRDIVSVKTKTGKNLIVISKNNDKLQVMGH